RPATQQGHPLARRVVPGRPRSTGDDGADRVEAGRVDATDDSGLADRRGVQHAGQTERDLLVRVAQYGDALDAGQVGHPVEVVGGGRESGRAWLERGADARLDLGGELSVELVGDLVSNRAHQ